MKKIQFLFCLLMTTFIANAQLKNDTTARSYLGLSTTFTQSQFDAYNNQPGMYQVKFPTDSTKSSSMILKYPSLDSVNVYWSNGVWNVNTATAITSNFNTLLMVSGINHTTAPQVPGVNTSTVTVSWNSIPGVTQYRFRIRPLGGSWNVSTITGTSRTMNTLTPNTTYEVVIRVYINSTVQGSYTEQVYQFTTPQFIPLPSCNPPSVTGNIIGNQLTLSWNPMPQATGYQVQIRQLGTLIWGGTTSANTSYVMTIDSTKAYEYQVRTECINAQTSWSLFSSIDTSTNAICQPPTGLYNVGNTFYWNNYQYSSKTQIQTRLVGTLTYGGGTTVTGNSWTNSYLWGQHEWRVRSQCHSGTVAPINGNDTYWTGWTYGITNFIPKPSMAQFVETNDLYPNPTNGIINGQGELIVTDMTGKVLMTGYGSVDLTNLSSGMYFVNKQKVIKQ